MSTGYTNISSLITSWRSPVSTHTSLPVTGNTAGDARTAQDTGVLYVWNGSSWVSGSGGSTDSFYIIQPDTGTAPQAVTATDTLTITSNILNINGNSSTDTIAIKTKAQYNVGNSGSASTINWTNGPAQLITLTGNVTLTFSNPESGAAYVIKIATGSGSYTVTWPNAVKWPGGTAPTITISASATDLINLYYDGTNYLGTFAQAFA